MVRTGLPGAARFSDPWSVRTCHPAPAYTRPRRFDVGTGGSFYVPTLRGVAETGPWGHDGRFGELEDAIDAILAAEEVELTADERRQLLEYLKLL